jgi:alginate O-acetyltransferase complex protein AlgI
VSFVSWAFVALFLIVFAARLTIGRRKNEPAFVAVLLVSSIVFYAWHVPAYILILLWSAWVDYVAGLWLGRVPMEAQTRRRLILVASLITNLGLLGFYKYGAFTLRAAEDLGVLLGVSVRTPDLNLLLPMGISFYTFQSLSYTIDVYRGAIAPVRGFGRFFLFLSFFPQLVAGPIVRASEFLPQMPRPRRLRLVVFYEGVWLIVCGFFLKMVCADNLAAYVNEHWKQGYVESTNASFALWLALMFSGQILADFAGYSSIARGLAYLLGYRLPINFNAPYVATSLKNFWERWHMTLSRWLRDYLYVPLGGNRSSGARTYVNLLLVMVLGGLWHGAYYTFIAWGALHGIALAVERALGLHRVFRADGSHKTHPVRTWRDAFGVRAAWFLVVQAVVLIAWIFFRSETFAGAATFVGNLAQLDFRPLPGWAMAGSLFLVPLFAMHAWTFLVERRRVRPLGPSARAALAAAMTYGIVSLYGGTSAFIYFQF